MANTGTYLDKSLSKSPSPPKSAKANGLAKRAMSPKSPNAGTKTTQGATRTAQPPLLNTVLAVLQAGKGNGKGLTLQSIKKGVVELYPHMQENFSNVRLRKAITKGIEQGSVSRPKGDEDAGFTGRFLLNKVYVIEKEKEAKLKLKAKLKVQAQASKKAEKLKSPKPKAKKSSTPIKNKAGSKSATAKKATAKSSAKAEKPKSKSPKAGSAKTTKSPREGKKISKTSKAGSAKVTKTEAATKAGAKKSLTKKTPKAKISSTPKLSKSATAGAKQKTVSVKKLTAKKTPKKAINFS